MTTNQTIDGVPRRLLIEVLSELENNWQRIDSEFGPVDGGLDGAIERGDADEIKELRALLDVSLTDEGEKAVVQPNDDQHASDHQFYTAQLQARAANVLGLDPENTSWFEVVGEMEKAAARPHRVPLAWKMIPRLSGTRSYLHDAEGSTLEDVRNLAGEYFDIQPLYAEQPAPVAVVMAERKHVPDFTQHPLLNKEYTGWNACIDEVTRLNTKE